MMARWHCRSGRWAALALLFATLGTRSPSAADAGTGISPAWLDKAARKVEAPAPALDPTTQLHLGPDLRQLLAGHPRARMAADRASRSGGPASGLGLHLDLAAASQRQQRWAEWGITWNERNGTPVSLDAPEVQRRAKPSAGVSPADAALEFIAANPAVFCLDQPGRELRLVSTRRDRAGGQHLAFQQYYGGLPVWGHDLVVHFTREGRIASLNARYGPTPRGVELTPAVDREAAISAAVTSLAADTPIEPLPAWLEQILEYHGPEAELCIWVDRLTQAPHLAWYVFIRPNVRDRWRYFIEAHTGVILEAYNITPTNGPATASAPDLAGITRRLEVYEQEGRFYLIDASRPIFQEGQPDILGNPQGVLWTLTANNRDLGRAAALSQLSSLDNTWTDPAAVSAHSNSGVIFEYYFDAHGRRGIDDLGSTMVSAVHVTDGGRSMANAYWNGALLAYGDGGAAFRPLAGALDVAAHEMTHGVIEYTVNLDYQFQAGALNESLADVFAAMVDRDDWLLAEDVVKKEAFPSGALRDMADPHNGGSRRDPFWQPASMDEYADLSADQDNGGVHLNNGVPNRACYLLATAVGRESTERIYYRVLEARYLNTQASFVDMRLAAARAAGDLFGASSAEAAAVEAAFDAVGIVGSTATEAPPDQAPVSGEEWIAVVPAPSVGSGLLLVRPVIRSRADIVQLTRTPVLTQTANPVGVSHDGSVIFFVDARRFVRAIRVDGSGEEVVSSNGYWSSIALSPDATRLAATTVYQDSTIYIFDLADPAASKAIHLYNPTTQPGIKTEVTRYADALAWDHTGTILLYDAFNSIPQSSSSSIDYWDINLLNVDTEEISSVLPAAPNGVSMGNPAYAQTNDHFIVLDRIDDNRNKTEIWAVNLFTGTANLVEANGTSIGFPRYSPDDRHLVFQRDEKGTPTLRQIAMSEDRIQPAGVSTELLAGIRRGIWFAIGTPPATAIEPEERASLPEAWELQPNYPNPFNGETVVTFTMPNAGEVRLAVYDLLGQEVVWLAAGPLPAGRHVRPWNGLDQAGRAAASGVYICRLQATTSGGGEVERHHSMVLLR